MEIASLLGFVMVMVGVFVGLIIKGADPVQLFTNVAALLIVLVGSFGAVWLSHTMKENMAALKGLLKVFLPGAPPDVPKTIERLVGLATRARAEGLLILEQEAAKEEDPFLKKGLLLASDGTDPAVMRDTLQTDVNAMKERHKTTANWWQTAGILAPTYGIIGAVVGLIAVLGNLDDPSQLGHGIGAAFVATFWGVFLANGLYLPFANKLKRLSAGEVMTRMIVIDGLMAIQQGILPSTVGEKLEGYIPPAARKAS